MALNARGDDIGAWDAVSALSSSDTAIFDSVRVREGWKLGWERERKRGVEGGELRSALNVEMDPADEHPILRGDRRGAWNAVSAPSPSGAVNCL